MVESDYNKVGKGMTVSDREYLSQNTEEENEENWWGKRMDQEGRDYNEVSIQWLEWWVRCVNNWVNAQNNSLFDNFFHCNHSIDH